MRARLRGARSSTPGARGEHETFLARGAKACPGASEGVLVRSNYEYVAEKSHQLNLYITTPRRGVQLSCSTPGRVKNNH